MRERKSMWEAERANYSRAGRQDIQFFRLQIGTCSPVNMFVIVEAVRQILLCLGCLRT